MPMTKELFAANENKTKSCKGCGSPIPYMRSTYCRDCKIVYRQYVPTPQEIAKCAAEIRSENAARERVHCDMKLSSYRHPKIYHVGH